MQVTDWRSLDAPSLTQAIIVQIVYTGRWPRATAKTMCQHADLSEMNDLEVHQHGASWWQCSCLRQPGPPWFEFLVLFDFLHHGIEEVERHLLWKIHKNSKEKLVKCAPKLLTCIGFLYKVVAKTTVSDSSMALGRFNLTFLSLELSLWNLAYLFIMFMATKFASDFLIFAQGLSYGLSKSKKRGKIITKLERP